MVAGCDVAARWCALAEQRLQHLSEMFETGRWRRYHSEIAFLENIQEAKRAVQTWRALATGADVAEAAASVTPAFGWSPATMPRVFPREQQAEIVLPKTLEPNTLEPNTLEPQTLQPKAVHIAPETAVPVRLDPQPDVLAEITEAPIAPLAAPAAVASFTAPTEMPPLKAPAARAPFVAPAVRSPLAPAAVAPFTAPEVRPPLPVSAAKPPKTAPAAMAALLPQFTPPAEEIVAAPKRVVEFTFSLDGLEAKYPLLRNAF
ncbi:TIGR03809 family protein [Bradyrhizobium amphicarpaeae]|uniref:TIGR03809 family protein n=1 Tax=Bradyrhizobium amphicarpaeae TaxID=1404768 RepID=UPI00138FF59A|nr:TIGR03809 family protein [Bradyrhizobium amphicarpaeae]